VDIVVDGDPEQAARSVARAGARAACFALSREFGSWRVAARDGSWQVDVEPMRGSTLDEDLALRDFTVNAIAEPLAGGEVLDPLGGAPDVRARVLRAAGPRAFERDPLRVLRMVRMSVELGFEPDTQTAALASASAGALQQVSAERVFAELRRIIACERARRGLEMISELGAGRVVLPELEALRGVRQNRFHHLDVLGHTLEVLERTIELAGPTGPYAGDLRLAYGENQQAVRDLLDEPLADDMTRGEALRWGALLHDAAKPMTRNESPLDGRVTFMGHDVRGAHLAREVLRRLRASDRLQAHVAALAREHLRLGFLVHEPQPLSRRVLYGYMKACEPVEVDVTLLSIADRLATRGDRAQESIRAHLALAPRVLAAAVQWRADGPGQLLLRGDDLAAALGIEPGPRLGILLDRLAEERYAGEISTREQALARAHELLQTI
jgi:putative nucleotidyltransferase with HDIG domain